APDVAQAVDRTARSLSAQTLARWELFLVGQVDAVQAPDRAVRMFPAASRARALEAAVGDAADFVVLLDAGATLPPTTLEKWAWFLSLHPGQRAMTLARTRVGTPIMLRKADVSKTGVDASRATAQLSAAAIEVAEPAARSAADTLPDD